MIGRLRDWWAGGVERRNYTAMRTAELEAGAEVGRAALGAVEIAAGMFARAFASADVSPVGVRTAGVSPGMLASVARRLIVAGESCHLIEVEGGAVVLREASHWSVTGGARGGWRYQVTLPGPSATHAEWVPGDQVVHCRYGAEASTPWRGRGPLHLAGLSGVLAVALERHLGQEAGGPVGHLIPVPQDASAEGDDDPFGPLKAQIATLRGRVGLVETVAAGYGEGRAAAPAEDWKLRRIGANPPDALPTLREQVEATILSACGIPPDLARAGGRTRESYRQWLHGSIEPLAGLVAAELRAKLGAPVSLSFGRLEAGDITGKARAWRSLVGKDATMPDADARRLIGLV